MPEALLKQVKKARLELLACVTITDESARLCRGSILFIFNGWVGQSRLFARVHEFNVDAQYTYRNSLPAFELTLPNGANHSTAREFIDTEVSRIEDFDSASKKSDPVKLPSAEMTSSVIPSLL